MVKAQLLSSREVGLYHSGGHKIVI
jgi:hypothetical protein